MPTNPNPDRLDEVRAEYAATGMVTSDGAVWLVSQVVVLREQVQSLRAAPAAVPSAPADRAAALRETAELVTGYAADHFPDEYDEYADQLADELRRVADEAQQPETPSALMRAHAALATQAGKDQAALARVRQLHDRLAEETDLASPDDPITRGAAAKRIATALDGWNPTGAPQCDVEFENGARCAKPAGHRPPGSDDPHVPAAVAQPGKEA